MNRLTTALAIAALLGSGVIGGVFLAFSSFIMKSFALGLIGESNV